MYFKYVSMKNIYQTYSFGSIIDTTLLKKGMDPQLLNNYDEYMEAEYVTDKKIMFRPKLDKIVHKKSPVTMLYERFDSVIYDVEQKEIVSMIAPEVSLRTNVKDMLYIYEQDIKAQMKREPIKAYEFVKGYTFHLFAEPIEYNSSLSDVVCLGVSDEDENDVQEEDWEMCDRNGRRKTNVNTMESIPEIKHDEPVYTWDILPDTMSTEQPKFSQLKIEFFRILTYELQELLDPKLCYTVRFQHPMYNEYANEAKIYILEAYRIENGVEVTRENLNTYEELIIGMDETRKEYRTSFPLQTPTFLGNVTTQEDLNSIKDSLEDDVPAVLLVDDLYNERSLLFNNVFYRREKMKDIQKTWIRNYTKMRTYIIITCDKIKKSYEKCWGEWKNNRRRRKRRRTISL